MTWKAQAQKMEQIEREVLSHIFPAVDKAQLFWLRIDCGMEYLLDRYSYQEAKKIWLTKTYWRWYRQTWAINDRKILHALKEQNRVLHLAEYMDTQRAKLSQYHITKGILKQLK